MTLQDQLRILKRFEGGKIRRKASDCSASNELPSLCGVGTKFTEKKENEKDGESKALQSQQGLLAIV